MYIYTYVCVYIHIHRSRTLSASGRTSISVGPTAASTFTAAGFAAPPAAAPPPFPAGVAPAGLAFFAGLSPTAPSLGRLPREDEPPTEPPAGAAAGLSAPVGNSDLILSLSTALGSPGGAFSLLAFPVLILILALLTCANVHLISHNVCFKVIFIRQFPHTSVKSIFILVIVKDTLTDLCGS